MSFFLLSAGPEGIGIVSVTSRTSSTLSVTWQRPSEPNGLVIQYGVLATPLNTEGLLSPLGSAVTVTLNIEVIENNTHHTYYSVIYNPYCLISIL